MRLNEMFGKEKAVFVVAAAVMLGSANLACAASGVKPAGKAQASVSLQPFKYQLTVMPQPQRVYNLSASQGAFRFDRNTVLWAVDTRDRPGAEMLAADLKFRSGLVVRIVEGAKPNLQGAKHVVRFERNGAALRAPLQPAVLKQIETRRAEGYCLLADAAGIVVRGQDQRGVLYGAQTLRQLVRADLSVAPLAIQDWPEMPWRMLYGYYNGPTDTPEQLQKQIEQAVLAKANMIIFESNWSGSSNWWYNPSGDRKILADNFFNTCRRYGIEAIPLVQGPGWGYGITDLDSMTAEAVWVKAEPVTLHTGLPTALAKVNVVTTESAPIIVTDTSGKTRYTQGKDFTVLIGDTSRPYAETNAAWSLQAVAGGAIGDGAQVLVSYNHVTPNYHKSYCLSEPRSYKIVDQTLDYVMTTYNPPIIHIGHDELWELATDSRCLESGLKPAELVYRDLMHWYNRIKKHNPKTVIMVWDDLFRDAPAGEVTGPLAALAGRIPKDIVLCPWYYYAKPGSKGDIEQRLSSQTAMGFPVIGVPSGYWMSNSLLWSNALLPYLKSGKSKGLMFTAWGEGLSATNVSASTELMWSGSKVDKNLFGNFESVTQRLKTKNLGMTFDFSRGWQRDALTALFNDGVKAGQKPADIAREVREKLIGDTTLFQKVYGKEQWATLAQDAPFTMQQASMLRKLPLLVQLFAEHYEARAAYDRGETAAATGKLRGIIEELHGIGYFSHEVEQQLLEKSRTQWLSPKEVFDLDLAVPNAQRGG